MRGLSWPHRGPLPPWQYPYSRPCGHTWPTRPPARAVSHHRGLLIPPPAVARVAHETTTLRATSRHGPSVPPPWPASRAATVWRSPSHWSAETVATARGGWHGASRNYHRYESCSSIRQSEVPQSSTDDNGIILKINSLNLSEFV